MCSLDPAWLPWGPGFLLSCRILSLHWEEPTAKSQVLASPCVTAALSPALRVLVFLVYPSACSMSLPGNAAFCFASSFAEVDRVGLSPCC